MGAALEIRLARRGDSGRVFALWLDLIEHHRRLDPGYPPLIGIREVLGCEIERGLRSRACRLLVADPGQEPIGFLFAEIQRARAGLGAGTAGRINEVYVEPAWRRHGVGKLLVRDVDSWFRARAVPRITVRVEPGNRDALQFWKRSGFQERAHILERV